MGSGIIRDIEILPGTGMLNVHLEHVSPVFREVAEEIKKTGKQIIDN